MKLERIGNIAKFINGVAFKPEDWNSDGLRIIRIQNLTNPSKPYNYTNRKVDDKYIVKRGDVLVSWSATIDVFIWNDDEALLNQHIFKVEFDKEKVDKHYFILALKHTIDDLSKLAHGSTMRHIVKGDFENHKIYLPPLANQKQIASLLGKSETLIQQRKESIAILDEFVKSTFYKMFGDPFRNGKKWERTILDKITNQITDGEHTTPIRIEYGIKLLSARNIKDGFLDFNSGLDYISIEEYERIAKRCKPQRNDILMSCSGSVGRVCVINTDEPLALVRSVALIKPIETKVKSFYLQYLMQSNYFQNEIKKSSKTSSQSNIFTGAIKKLPIIVPPLDLQNQFATIVEKAEVLKTQFKVSLNELENLFGALSQKAFKDELSLGNIDTNEIISQHRLGTYLEKIGMLYESFNKYNRTAIGISNLNIQIEKARELTNEILKIQKLPEEIKIAIKDFYAIEADILNLNKEPLKSINHVNIPEKEIIFNETIGFAVIETLLTNEKIGFSFEEFERILYEDKVKFSYREIKDFIFNLIEEKRLIQIYSSKEWITNFKAMSKSSHGPVMYNLDKGSIWFKYLKNETT